jgi:hypothetical protein
MFTLHWLGKDGNAAVAPRTRTRPDCADFGGSAIGNPQTGNKQERCNYDEISSQTSSGAHKRSNVAYTAIVSKVYLKHMDTN